MVANLRAMLDRIGNVRYQRALLGADLASLNAKAAIDAVRAITMRTRKDRNRPADADADAQLGAAFNQDSPHPPMGCGP